MTNQIKPMLLGAVLTLGGVGAGQLFDAAVPLAHAQSGRNCEVVGAEHHTVQYHFREFMGKGYEFKGAIPLSSSSVTKQAGLTTTFLVFCK